MNPNEVPYEKIDLQIKFFSEGEVNCIHRTSRID
jgi:hypothetical protein